MKRELTEEGEEEEVNRKKNERSQDKCYRGVRDGVRQGPLGGV